MTGFEPASQRSEFFALYRVKLHSRVLLLFILVKNSCKDNKKAL